MVDLETAQYICSIPSYLKSEYRPTHAGTHQETSLSVTPQEGLDVLISGGLETALL